MTTTTETSKHTSTKKQNKRKQTNKQTKEKSNQIIQLLLPSALERVTLGCSLTHVLQAPNTQPYHS